MTAARSIQEPVLVPLSAIRLDGGTQARAELSRDVVDEYAENVGKLPPVDVFHDGTEYWLADGFHRHAAFVAADRKKIPCLVHQGTRRDAILFSVGANDAHGLRRTNADKRRAVTLLVRDDEWRRWSDKIIAEKCGVSREFVCRLRAEEPVIGSQVRTGQDGKTRKMPDRKAPPKPVVHECPHHGCQFDDGAECPVCASRTAKGLPNGPPPPKSEPRATRHDPDPWDDDESDTPDPVVDTALSLETLAAQRAADPDYQEHRRTQAAVAAAIPQSRAQRIVDFVLDGGELAMLRLGVDWSVTKESLQRAYRSRAAKAHPDRGGGTAAFVSLNRDRDLVLRMLGG